MHMWASPWERESPTAESKKCERVSKCLLLNYHSHCSLVSMAGDWSVNTHTHTYTHHSEVQLSLNTRALMFLLFADSFILFPPSLRLRRGESGRGEVLTAPANWTVRSVTRRKGKEKKKKNTHADTASCVCVCVGGREKGETHTERLRETHRDKNRERYTPALTCISILLR